MKSLLYLSALLSTSLYAGEVKVNFNHCYSGTTPDVLNGGEGGHARVDHWRLNGTVLSNTEDKLFHGGATHCAGFTFRWNLKDGEYKDAERRSLTAISQRPRKSRGWG